MAKTHLINEQAERCFAGLVGQSTAKAQLLQLWEQGRSGFILLTGEEGRGKRSFAFAFASYCLSMGAEGGDVLAWIEAGTHPDFIEIQPEEAGKLIPVDRIRREVTADVGMRPQLGRYKVYLIHADALGEPSQNALLKTLEEPPDYCLFLLTAARPDRLLPTVLSRAVEIRLSPYTDAELAVILKRAQKERGELLSAASGRTDRAQKKMAEDQSDPEEARSFAIRLANGSAGRALALLGDAEARLALTDVNDFLFAVPDMQLTDCLLQGAKIFEEHKGQVDLVFDLIELWLRDRLLADQPEVRSESLVYRARAAEFKAAAAAGAGAGPMISLSTCLQKVREARRYNGNYEIDITYLLLNIYKELRNA